jgi:hypothetical protein
MGISNKGKELSCVFIPSFYFSPKGRKEKGGNESPLF